MKSQAIYCVTSPALHTAVTILLTIINPYAVFYISVTTFSRRFCISIKEAMTGNLVWDSVYVALAQGVLPEGLCLRPILESA